MLSKKFTAVAGAAAEATDDYFENVSLLLHGDGTNGAQNNTFTDSSSNNFTITRNGNTTQGSFSPYGSNWSNYFDGGSNYLTVGNPSTSSALDFGSGDFTIESWVFPTVTTPILVIGSLDNNSGNGCWWMVINATFGGGGIVQFGYNTTAGGTGTNILFGSGTFTTNTWSHVAVTRSGSSIRAFVNGSQVGSTNTGIGSSAIYAVNQNIQVGRTIVNVGASYQMTGYLSNTRLVKGGALYTSNFTPNTAPLSTTVSSGTVSLLTCQSNRFVDSSASPLTITVNGSPSVQRFSPFNPTSSYSAATIGGSGYFDGSGDYLATATTSSFAFGTGNFTIEGWVYMTAYTSTGACMFGTVNGSTAGYYVNLGSDINSLRVTSNASGSWADTISVSSGNGVPLNAWTHIALVRNGSSLILYKNGVNVANTSSAGSYNFTSPSNAGYVGYVSNGSSTQYFQGYMSDIRVSNSALSISVPTSPLSSSGSVLCLSYTNGAIYDNAMMNDLETVGNAQISTSVKRYGTGSIAFDGSGDYLVPNAASSNVNLAFGTGDFTVEAWVYPTSFTGQSNSNAIFDFRPYNTNGLYPFLFMNLTTGYLTYYVNSANAIATSSAPTQNSWNHIALVRSSGSTKLYLNGTQVGSTYTDTNNYLSASGRPVIGVSGYFLTADYFTGYIDDLRITKGVARYTSNFTAPTAALPDK